MIRCQVNIKTLVRLYIEDYLDLNLKSRHYILLFTLLLVRGRLILLDNI